MNTREAVDEFYAAHGPCCAGCDHWRYFNSRAGECLNSKMVQGAERGGPLGIESASLRLGAGHVMTPREHVCAHFADTPTQPIGEK